MALGKKKPTTLQRIQAWMNTHNGIACAGIGTVFAVAVGLLSLLFLIRQSYNPFIYFRF